MTKRIQIKGDIVDDMTAQFYAFFGMQAVSPSAVAKVLNDDDDNDDGDVQPDTTEDPITEDDVVVDIASNGGDVFAGSEIYTLLKDYKGTVHVNVQGLAASAASVVAMAGDKVSISPTAQIMIHKAWSVSQGNADDLEHEAGVLNGIDQSIASAYELKTGMKQEDLLQLMAKETWLGAQDAVDQGFADEVMFVDKKKPQVVNSVSSIPSKDAVNKFMNLLLKANGKSKKVPVKSQQTNSLRDSKLTILMGKEKKEG